MGHCLLKIDIVIASGRCCVYRKKHSVSYRGLTMVSIKTTKNTNNVSIFNWIPAFAGMTLRTFLVGLICKDSIMY